LNRVLLDPRSDDVVVVAGLPGAGKTTWRRRHLPDLPVVSLDELRTELRVAPTADQGPVVARAKELARDHLRHRRPFAWDATNVTRHLRDPLVALCAGYGARVRIIYVEAPYDELLRRNRARPNLVPVPVLARLIDRLDVPDPTEAHRVEWVHSAPV
jgi:predicted kinase